MKSNKIEDPFRVGDLVKMHPLRTGPDIPEKDSVGIIVSIAYIDTARMRGPRCTTARYNIKWLNCQDIMCDYHKHHLIRLSGPVE